MTILNLLIQKSLQHRFFIVVLTLVLIGFGIKSFQELSIDAFPDVSTTQVKIIIKSPGMTPEEVEAQITTPIEQEMLGIPHQKILRSVSKYALTDITIDFDDKTDIYWARQQVNERLSAVMENLPPGVAGGLAPITTPLGEMFMFTIEEENTKNKKYSLAEKRAVLDWIIRPQLRTVPGVADVNSLGGYVQTFEVIPDANLLANSGLSMNDLENALANNNRNDGAGRIDNGEESLLVRSEGAIQTLEDVKNIIIKTQQSQHNANFAQIIHVGDVATVKLGSLTRYGAVTKNGNDEAVEGLVLGLRGANAKAVIHGIKSKIAEIQKTLPDGLVITPFYDRSQLVERAINTVSKSLLEAICLVLILLLAFLGNLRAALVVAIMLPLSALSTFILMNYFGLSANLMSLGGLAIAIGMLVDAAVVVVENIETQIALHKQKEKDLLKTLKTKTLQNFHEKSSEISKKNNENLAEKMFKFLQLVLNSTKEVCVPVASGILIIIIVFLPLLTLQDLEGKMFSPVALTIVFALSSSLILSLTIVPVLSSWLFFKESLQIEKIHNEPILVQKLNAIYEKILNSALNEKNSKKYIFSAIFLLIISLIVFTFLGKSFMPIMDEGDMILQLEKLPSISLNQTIETDKKVQKEILQNIPEITEIIARSGSDELGLDPMGLNQTDSFLVLKPRSEWRPESNQEPEWLQDQLRAVMQNFPGITYAFTQPIDMRVSEMLTGVRGDLAIKIFGDDISELNRLAAEIENVVKKINGAEDTLTVQNEGVQYLKISLNRSVIGQLGLNINDVQNELKTMLEGKTIGKVIPNKNANANANANVNVNNFHEKSENIYAPYLPLVLRADAEIRNNVEAFKQFRLKFIDPQTNSEQSVPLSEIADIALTDGAVKIDHENAQRYAVVQTNVRDRDLVGFVEEAKAKVNQSVKLPESYHLSWGGQFENQQRAAERLMIVVPISIAMIFFLLFSTFGSVKQALLVLANIPFAMIGGVFALFLANEYLSVPASVGFIALLGVAVLNGVVMVSYFNQLLENGLSLVDAVYQGAKRRLRPVMMTASIAAFGLVPMLFATGPGSEVQRPLAIVVIGGLITSTLLTLVLLPILFKKWGGN